MLSNVNARGRFILQCQLIMSKIQSCIISFHLRHCLTTITNFLKGKVKDGGGTIPFKGKVTDIYKSSVLNKCKPDQLLITADYHEDTI